MILGQAQRIAELNKLPLASEIRSMPVIVFTSGKGGTGKTTMALNMANLFASSGKRVLFVDFDLDFANAHVMLNIFPEFTLCDYFSKKTEFENIIFNYKKNLSFIFGESGSGRKKELSKARLNEFFYKAKSSAMFDLIILDTASGGADETLEIISFADIPVVVATPEPTAVMDAYAIIKLMLFSGIKNKTFVLINKAPDKTEAQTAFENINAAVKHFLKSETEMLGFISESKLIKNAAYEQRLFSEELTPKLSRELRNVLKKFDELTLKFKNG